MPSRLLPACFCLSILLPFAAIAQSPIGGSASQSTEPAQGVLTFRTESRQVIVEAEVWEKNNGKDRTEHTSADSKGLRGYEKGDLKGLPPPARGLAAADFHIFDNGMEQKINYFREADFPALDITNQWQFIPTIRGIWGIPMFGYLSALEPPSATYLFGYIPPPLAPGECHAIRVVAENREVQLNRTQYCAPAATDVSGTATVKETKLRSRMESLLTSGASGSTKLHIQASVFWSSGVLAIAREAQQYASATTPPANDFTYVVEVHDSKAPASVHIATEFNLFAKGWDYPCPKDQAEIHLLGVIYDGGGHVVHGFGDTYSCSMVITPALQRWRPRYIAIPTRFDTQIDLRPGDYELRVVVSDGNKFGQGKLPLHIEPLDPHRIELSDVILCDFLRDASWILRDAASVSPSLVNPAPLVSKNVQFFPANDGRVRPHAPVSLYFEIYKSLLDTDETAIYYSMRVTDLKTGALMMNTGQMSAATWVVPGNVVIPIGLNLDIKKLPKGSYRLEVQASDATGGQTEWRLMVFSIE